MDPRVARFAGFEGIHLVADIWGDDDAWPVLLMHGGGQTRHAWGDTAACSPRPAGRRCHSTCGATATASGR